MDADRLAGRGEEPNCPEGIGNDEDAPLGLPEGDLPPEPVPDDGDEPASGPRIAELHAQVRHSEPCRNGDRVALVPVEKLDDRVRFTERADPLVDPRPVHRVEDEHRAADLERVRRAGEKARLGPAEPAFELVADLEAHPPMNVSYRRNTFRLMMIPAIAHAATLVASVFTSEPASRAVSGAR